MDEDDFRSIVAVIQDELRTIGGEDLADVDNYVVGGGELERPLSNAELAIQMLQSFERLLAMRDRSTYTRSMSEIGELVTGGERPESAVVLLGARIPEMSGLPPTLNLSDTPDLSDILGELQRLIGRLKEARRG